MGSLSPFGCSDNVCRTGNKRGRPKIKIRKISRGSPQNGSQETVNIETLEKTTQMYALQCSLRADDSACHKYCILDFQRIEVRDCQNE